MAVIVYLLASVQLGGSVFVWLLSRSAMHEILAGILFAGGATTLALAAILGAILQQRAPAPVAQTPETFTGPRVGDRIKTYKGHAIIKTAEGVRVDQLQFANVLLAEKHIDGIR